MIQPCSPERRSAAASPSRSIGGLIRDLTDDTRELLRQEVELAKAELSEKLARISRNAAYLAAGALIAWAGVLVLLIAAGIGVAQWLDNAMSPEIAAWLGPLIVGFAVLIIGSVLVIKAIATLRNTSLTPRKTIQSLRENKQWLKNRMT